MGQTGSKSKGGPTVTQHDRAVLKLKVQRDKLDQYKKRLAVVIEQETQIAKDNLVTNRTKAKLALRKKKRQQSLLDQLESQSNTLEEIIETIEFKLIEKDVIHGLEMGNNVLKEINKELSIDKVDRIMDETAEGVAYQQELSDRLSEVLTTGEEREVDEELLQLQKELGMIEEEPQTKIPEMPSVPENDIKHGQEVVHNDEPVSSSERKQKQHEQQPMLA